MPDARNWIANTVLPLPAVPDTSVVRFFGNPPFAITSKLSIPVGSFSIASLELSVVAVAMVIGRPLGGYLFLAPVSPRDRTILFLYRTDRRSPDVAAAAAAL